MRKTLEQFVEDARKVHRDKYCYDHVVYTTNSTKVTILCPEHGPFSQLPVRHTSGKMEEYTMLLLTASNTSDHSGTT